MTSYLCSSKCAHCAYLCGPDWSPHYIDDAGTTNALAAVKRGGCRSIHIGGGEPFLRPQGLLRVLELCAAERVSVEYVETNAGWFVGSEANHRLLEQARAVGLSTLLVSISPFHNSSIPWNRTRGLIEACSRHDIGVFPWVADFVSDIEAFDPARTHSLAEYEDRYGPGYVSGIPRRYWVSLRGRAVETFASRRAQTPTEELLRQTRPCGELFGTSHFHVDLYGNYIPGVCSGLAMDVADVPGPVRRERYPVLATLMEHGLGAVVEWAVQEHGFEARPEYGGTCELCYHLRHHLVVHADFRSRDLAPQELYDKVESP